MRTKGRSPPNSISPTLTGITRSLYRPGRSGQVDPPDSPGGHHLTDLRPASDYGFRRSRDTVPDFVCVAGVHKRREQWMGTRRLGFEFRVELHGQKPRMARHLSDLD